LISVMVILLAGLGGLAYRLFSQQRPPGPPLFFGFPPTYPGEVYQHEMRPVLDFLERGLNQKVEMVVTQSYQDLRQQLAQGKLHFAMLPPLQFVLARHRNPKLRTLVSLSQEGARSYQALLVTRSDSTITTPEQLRSKRFCYVDPGSTSGYLLPRHFLRKQGLDPDGLFSATIYSKNHLSVIKDIMAGRCDAGAIYSGAMISSPSHGMASSRLRILAITGQVPWDMICTSTHLPESASRRARAVLMGMQPGRDLGRKIVGPTFRISGFVEPAIEKYDLIRSVAVSEGLLKQEK